MTKTADKTKRKNPDNIEIQEVTRNTAAGRFTYAIYNNKVVRRQHRRGRPTYDTVAGISLGAGDKPLTREIPLDSQLGRIFSAPAKAPKATPAVA